MNRIRREAIALVFAGLLVSSAYFWHARDWNTASRLMLTYALVDRGTLTINGLEDQTRDRARIGRTYYTDKLPGFSLLAIPPYLAAKSVLHLPDHPLNRKGFTHWPADFWITLGTSGVATALIGAMLASLAFDLGCGPWRAILVGLAYGWATPARVYSGLAYGHQPAACALLGSLMALLAAPSARRPLGWAALAGFLAALAAVVELQVGPVGALFGLLLLVQVVSGSVSWRAVPAFGLGALGPTLTLLVYSQLAFGSPLDMGYFHEDIQQFRDVHTGDNPLGLGAPDLSRIVPLLWGEYRGLLFYAPILTLTPIGWIALGLRKRWAVLYASLAACLAVFLVNLGYPEWTGGWSTGPRLLVPLLPFAMIGVAGAMTVGGRGVFLIGILLAISGSALMVLFQGAGGRVPQGLTEPLRQFVLPAWGLTSTADVGDPGLARNLVSIAFPEAIARWGRTGRWLQVLPLMIFELSLVLLAAWRFAPGRGRTRIDEPDPSTNAHAADGAGVRQL